MIYASKRVSFKNNVHMRYTLNLDDYLLIKNTIWWSDDDYLEAEKSARSELNRLITIHPQMSFKDAKTLLYQPNNLKQYNHFFFIPSIDSVMKSK
jgi:hypothetical protein